MIGDRPEVGILVHPREAGREDLLEAALERLRALAVPVWIAGADPAGALADHGGATGLLITVGGDGTFLLGARLAVGWGIPVLGVNRGQLGFLTDVDVSGLPAAVDAIAAGRHRLARRSLLRMEVSATGTTELALNEVVVKSLGSNLARMRIDADDELLGEFDADGVIIASATGSTAYALSAGGPPVDPRVRATVVVPLAPHAVISRAVVVPEAVALQVTILRGRTFAAADGTPEVQIPVGCTVVARPGPELHVVQLAGSPPFLRRLREKVRFGMPLKGDQDEPDWHQHPHD